MATDLSADALLDTLGLMRKTDQTSWFWPAVGGVAVGLAAGIALGMAFAPKPGAELRKELGEKAKSRDLRGIAETARETMASARESLSSRS